MHTLTLRCVQPYLLGERKIAAGESITFQTKEEQHWFRSNLMWTAFQPEFVEVDDHLGTVVTGDSLTLHENDLLIAQDRIDELEKELEAKAITPAGEEPATNLAPVSLSDLLLTFGRDQLLSIEGIGTKSADALIAWAESKKPAPVDPSATPVVV